MVRGRTVGAIASLEWSLDEHIAPLSCDQGSQGDEFVERLSPSKGRLRQTIFYT